MTGVVHVKHGSNWKAVNFNSQKLWVKHSGTWKEPTAYVRHSGSWKKVYPSDLEAWTTSKLGTSSAGDTASNPPNLSTNPSYLHGNLLIANAEVRWNDRASPASSYGQAVRTWGFGWTPVTSAGFRYGAITRVEIVIEAAWKDTPGGTDWFRLGVRPKGASYKDTANLTGTETVYTFDYTVASWTGLSDAAAGELHLSPSSSRSVEVSALYNNATAGSDQQVAVEDVKCRIKYKYN